MIKIDLIFIVFLSIQVISSSSFSSIIASHLSLHLYLHVNRIIHYYFTHFPQQNFDFDSAAFQYTPKTSSTDSLLIYSELWSLLSVEKKVSWIAVSMVDVIDGCLWLFMVWCFFCRPSEWPFYLRNEKQIVKD